MDEVEHFIATQKKQDYGQIKTHTNGLPTKPVVTFYQDPTFNLAKYLADWFMCMSQCSPSLTVQNFFDLASHLKDLKIPASAELLSFDVVSLSTRTPPWNT